MMKRFLYWLFDSENEDLNSQIRFQIELLDSDPIIQEFFKKLNDYGSKRNS